MKTPDEIKKRLRWCGGIAQIIKGCSGGCPYYVSNDDGCQQEDLTADALAYIQQLEAHVPKWISVKERLPEQHMQNCLCWCVFENGPPENGFAHVATWYSHGDNGYVNGPHFSDEGYCGMHVTHWMTIPEAPKEDAHEVP